MAGLIERFTNAAASVTLAVAMAAGPAAPANAQTLSPSASAPAKNDKPFEGSRDDLNRQKIAADQAIPNMMRIKDKSLFDIIKNSVTAKLEGKLTNPVGDVKDYLDRKEAAANNFFDQRLKSGQDGPTPPNGAQMKAARESLLKSSDTNAWANETKGWDQYSLQQLKGHHDFAMKQDRMFAGSAASMVAGVSDPGLLAVVAQTQPYSDKNKGEESSLRDKLTVYANAQNQKRDKLDSEARSQATAAVIASTMAPPAPVTAQPATSLQSSKINNGVPEAPRLSSVDCKAAMNDAARGGTTTVGPDGRLKVELADRDQAVKDMASKPQDQWPDLSKWDKANLRLLKKNVVDNLSIQTTTIMSANHGIMAGKDPAAMTAGIQNPDIREIMKGINPGESPAQNAYLQSLAIGKLNENFSAARLMVDNAMEALDANKPSGRTPLNPPPARAPGC